VTKTGVLSNFMKIHSTNFGLLLADGDARPDGLIKRRLHVETQGLCIPLLLLFLCTSFKTELFHSTVCNVSHKGATDT